MVAHDTLRRDGTWTVELRQPLQGHKGPVDQIDIRQPTADVVIRWRDGDIPSILALLSELCDLPERLLRQLPALEFDRVIFALMNSLPPTIKDDMEAAKRPLATPDYDLPPEDKIPVPDQIDPRFPAVDGPVQRLAPRKPSPPPPPSPQPEDQALQYGPPPITEAVAR